MYDPSRLVTVRRKPESEDGCGGDTKRRGRAVGNSANTCDVDAFEEPMVLRRLFKWCYDLKGAPPKRLLRVLAEYTSKPEEKETLLRWSSNKGSSLYEENVVKPRLGLLEVLLLFKSSRPPLTMVINALAPMLPRYYSIASSPLTTPGIASIAFSVVKDGHCTPWLGELCEAINRDAGFSQSGHVGTRQLRLAVFMKRTTTFALPADERRPVVMVGPGTGVAPFLGFIQHRQHQLKAQQKIKKSISSSDNLAQHGDWGGIDLSTIEGMDEEEACLGCCTGFDDEEFRGDMWLFFGCRHEKKDYLYREELQEANDMDVLQRLYTAFSRDTEEKVYVQHLLAKEGAAIVRLLLDNEGYLFVCGDGNKMAKDVRKAMEAAFVQHKGMSEKESKKMVMSLMKEHRFVMDIWTA